jgi:predicted TIM-barrel fold metal-dependent hydrolase
VTGVISADDHLIEPPGLWSGRLRARLRDAGPHVVRERGRAIPLPGQIGFESSSDGDWADVWHFEDSRVPVTGQGVASTIEKVREGSVVTFDQLRPGNYQQRARLEDMKLGGIEASLCFPNFFVRFCGQRFLFAKDKELALACVQAYNDYIIEEWCGGSGGALIPCVIVPLWDVSLATQEIRRVAPRGVHAVSFSELPPFLELPSIHGGYWDPFLAACTDNDVAIMMHVGSSSQLPSTSADAPSAVFHALPSNNSAAALVDWICSGKLATFRTLKLCLAESNIGWIPYFLERLDQIWLHKRAISGLESKISDLPSTYYRQSFYVTFFSDDFGTRNLDVIGEDQAIFETDYPHGDSTWPNCLDVARLQTSHLTHEVREKVLRGNARKLFHLD